MPVRAGVTTAISRTGARSRGSQVWGPPGVHGHTHAGPADGRKIGNSRFGTRKSSLATATSSQLPVSDGGSNSAGKGAGVWTIDFESNSPIDSRSRYGRCAARSTWRGTGVPPRASTNHMLTWRAGDVRGPRISRHFSTSCSALVN